MTPAPTRLSKDKRTHLRYSLAISLAVALMFGTATAVEVYWAVALSTTDRAKAVEAMAPVERVSGAGSSLLEAEVDNKLYYRVAAGPFPDRAKAIETRDLLRSGGWPDAWILAGLDLTADPPEAPVGAGALPASTASRTITVGLTWISGPALVVGTEGRIRAEGFAPEGADAPAVEAERAIELVAEGDWITVKTSDEDPGTKLAPPVTVEADIGAIWLRESYRVYKGAIKVTRKQGSDSLYVADVLDVEDYLLSVLPAEIGGNSPKEAYKAQAVVARTEALSFTGRHKDMGWDICDSTHCQVFRGLYGQSPNQDIVRAVQETCGEVLFSGSSMVRTASFHSSCGGWTESSEDVWGSRFAHLTNVGCRIDPGQMPDLRDEAILRKYIEEANRKDLCYGGTGYRWKASVEVKAVEAGLARMVSAGTATVSGETAGIGAIRVARRSARGAALELRVPSGTGEYIIKGELNIRSLFGGPTLVKSGVFVILPVSKDGSIDIIGAGYGHGVGMCQDGAKALAKLGKDYKSILSFYYKGGSVVKVY